MPEVVLGTGLGWWALPAIGLLAGILALDETAVGQTWFGQPLAAGVLTGYLFGDPVTGLAVALPLQIGLAGNLPVGQTFTGDRVWPLAYPGRTPGERGLDARGSPHTPGRIPLSDHPTSPAWPGRHLPAGDRGGAAVHPDSGADLDTSFHLSSRCGPRGAGDDAFVAVRPGHRHHAGSIRPADGLATRPGRCRGGLSGGAPCLLSPAAPSCPADSRSASSGVP